MFFVSKGESQSVYMCQGSKIKSHRLIWKEAINWPDGLFTLILRCHVALKTDVTSERHFLIRELNYFTCPPTTTFNCMLLITSSSGSNKTTTWNDLKLFFSHFFSPAKVLVGRLSCGPTVSEEEVKRSTPSTNSPSSLPPLCALHISSFHPQICRCLNSFFTDAQQFKCSPRRPNTSENQRRRKPGGGGGRGGSGGIRRRRYLIAQQATGLLSHSEDNLCSTFAI